MRGPGSLAAVTAGWSCLWTRCAPRSAWRCCWSFFATSSWLEHRPDHSGGAVWRRHRSMLRGGPSTASGCQALYGRRSFAGTERPARRITLDMGPLARSDRWNIGRMQQSCVGGESAALIQGAAAPGICRAGWCSHAIAAVPRGAGLRLLGACGRLENDCCLSLAQRRWRSGPGADQCRSPRVAAPSELPAGSRRRRVEAHAAGPRAALTAWGG